MLKLKLLSFIIFISFFTFCDVTLAKKRSRSPYDTKAKGRVMKNFDYDKDGYLSYTERAYYLTHKRMGYPIVSKKKMIPYDLNHNKMLENDEHFAYKRDKANKSLKKLTPEQKKEIKKIEKGILANKLKQNNYIKMMDQLRDQQQALYK